MKTPYVASSGRRPHYLRTTPDEISKLLELQGWTWCGQIWAAEKKIAGRGVLMFIEHADKSHVWCRFTRSMTSGRSSSATNGTNSPARLVVRSALLARRSEWPRRRPDVDSNRHRRRFRMH